MAELVDAQDLKSCDRNIVPVRFRSRALILVFEHKKHTSYEHAFYYYYNILMWFTIRRTGDLNTNERVIAFYKKELRASHILDKAKKQKHYWTKRYKKFVDFDFPSSRRYKRIKAIVSSTYRKQKKKYNTLAQLWKIV